MKILNSIVFSILLLVGQSYACELVRTDTILDEFPEATPVTPVTISQLPDNVTLKEAMNIFCIQKLRGRDNNRYNIVFHPSVLLGLISEDTINHEQLRNYGALNLNRISVSQVRNLALGLRLIYLHAMEGIGLDKDAFATILSNFPLEASFTLELNMPSLGFPKGNTEKEKFNKLKKLIADLNNLSATEEKPRLRGSEISFINTKKCSECIAEQARTLNAIQNRAEEVTRRTVSVGSDFMSDVDAREGNVKEIFGEPEYRGDISVLGDTVKEFMSEIKVDVSNAEKRLLVAKKALGKKKKREEKKRKRELESYEKDF
ncbi:MAG: hypothetical protein K2Q34_00045 [Alphaproteobacteria bacterium]|nr:hypothetical protein [Alphaproteobacteria bacterium]